MFWFNRRTASQAEFDRVVAEMQRKLDAAAESPAPELKPGICECGHIRSGHYAGKGHCCAQFPANKDWPHGSVCACQIYIPKWDEGGDPPPRPDPDPGVEDSELEELRRMAQLEAK